MKTTTMNNRKPVHSYLLALSTAWIILFSVKPLLWVISELHLRLHTIESIVKEDN